MMQWCCKLVQRSTKKSILLVLILASALICSGLGQGPCGKELADISVFPGDPLYYNSTLINNPAFAHILPAFVALPETVKDVQRCLDCAYVHSVPFTVKCGGHSPIGKSTIDGSQNGAFVIYLSKMKSVEIISEDKVKVQAGARWENVDVVKETGNLIVGGICPSVGVAGFTLGGGFSFISRKYGLAIDNLLSLTMITVDGSQVVIADADTNTDLYWALRGGGGGNFGVVVDFTFQLVPAKYTTYVYGSAVYSKETSRNIARVLSMIGSEAYEPELYLDLALTAGNELHLAYFNLGPLSKATEGKLADIIKLSSSNERQEFRAFWESRDFHLSRVPYPAVEDSPIMVRATLIKTITPAVAKVLVETEVPTNCLHAFAQLGGAVTDHDPTETAFFYRYVQYEIYSTCSYKDDAEKKSADKYLREVFARLEETGDCQGNYLNDPMLDLDAWQFKYYGHNYGRLVEIQNKWNPLHKGTYHYVQSIGSDHKVKEARSHNEL